MLTRRQVWDSTTLQCKRTLEGHEDNVRVLTVGSRHVFSGSWDKTIRVWDIDTLECIKVRRPNACRPQCAADTASQLVRVYDKSSSDCFNSAAMLCAEH